ncbi:MULTISPECIES: hypothetical protein [unclassified Flavobacterium]|uniref:hypothetical protein n=1 Tax=unclassified Flavobacterium TaxID=196869 RepID=UPI00086E54EF|nr:MULTISPECIES: hypothetical protein [unclassified Flavobacterium]MBN9284301.1 hypothetical protein [Flavobacterium sp.]ODS80252.1 MAG: hypothetical protein ABS44_20720 [Chryseobacterium sp. SCN 40-13]OJV73000.1 MAG: hypothetical protein BGO42_00750 [Flavobacterium sp. 40-81]
MEEIKTFVNEFLKAEALAADALVKPNLDDYNNKLVYMNSFCIEQLQNKFGMVPRTELWDDDFYEEWQDAIPSAPRNIYKISQYQDEIYGDVYVVYVSGRSPINMIFRYGESIFVAKINDELKIVKDYTFGDQMRIKKKFETGIGLGDISFESLKNPVAIERYMAPTHDKDGMEHYLSDI